ncbi:hypothetical protein DWX27_19420 [Bacteroides intestinalis]|uniref:Mannosyl-glycoprotein endo-beta-N-acetylglucosamidase-like domain-containing protein n=2 Tax=Bacteroides intestinalis TaxID=329854 RepID=A0AAQ0LK17_9BACE|nr:hypothetical protein DWX27_19420 [Bacteroides intestinalis]
MQERLNSNNSKRDMRKKVVKSSRPTYKKRIKKAQQGIKFVSYNALDTPTIDYKDITNPINPFSEYNYSTTYNKPEALVVPVRDNDVVATDDVVVDKPTAVASKVVVNNTANSTWKSPYRDRSKWVADLTSAYKRAGITNDNAIKMLLAQDALESGWGKSAQGKFNFGNLTTGAKWKGDYVDGRDKNAKGEAIKQRFRSYNSMDEYAADKIQFLKRLYDFNENDDINKFTAKLTGANKGKRRYAEAKEYANLLRGVYNSFKAGGIIKYQNPAQPIKYRGGYDKRGNMVVPVTNDNGMNNVTTPEVTITPRNINIAGAVDRGRRESAPYVGTLMAGAVFGPLSVVGGYAGNEAVNKITNIVSNGKYDTWGEMVSNTTGLNPILSEFTNPGALLGGAGINKFGPKLKPVEDLAIGGNRLARARIISKTINQGKPTVESLPNNVGWGPKQSIHVVHDKNSARLPKLYFPERWDAVNEGAPEAGIWYQGKLGNPRTAANHSIPGKAEKAAKARERFAKRPYRVEGDLQLDRPITTVGDVPNRAALERAADKMNADGVVFNNVYDNGYSNNQIIFSLRDDLKNGRMFKKDSKPLERREFIDTGTSMNGDLDTKINMRNFVEYLLNPKTQQRVVDVDAELGTKYGEAVSEFIRKYKAGELNITPRIKGELDAFGDAIRTSQTVPSESFLQSGNYDDIFFDILKRDPAHVPGHEAKHGIEMVNAALMKGNMTKEEYLRFMRGESPRLQALMKDNILSEDEFVQKVMKEHPEYNAVKVRNKYKYLSAPTEFNSQLHPLVEFEQRAGKSGVPNFKSVSEIDRLVNNNPYVGTDDNNGLRNLRLIFNYMIKDKEEFMRRFNKYGFSTAVGVPTAATINNYDNE